jgi:hypothetical protein
MKPRNATKYGKQRGRPPKPLARRRSVKLTLRLTLEERRAIQAEAKRKKLTVSGMLLGPWRKEKEDK